MISRFLREAVMALGVVLFSGFFPREAQGNSDTPNDPWHMGAWPSANRVGMACEQVCSLQGPVPFSGCGFNEVSRAERPLREHLHQHRRATMLHHAKVSRYFAA